MICVAWDMVKTTVVETAEYREDAATEAVTVHSPERQYANAPETASTLQRDAESDDTWNDTAPSPLVETAAGVTVRPGMLSSRTGDQVIEGTALLIAIEALREACTYVPVSAAVARTVHVPATEYVNVGEEGEGKTHPVVPESTTEYVMAAPPDADASGSALSLAERESAEGGAQTTFWAALEMTNVRVADAAA